jgi:hypothetical protein
MRRRVLLNKSLAMRDEFVGCASGSKCGSCRFDDALVLLTRNVQGNGHAVFFLPLSQL